ncbi:hypothetical protein COLO4_04616 [Corchorus olitorius]|uniref:Uncharacterized protein n=1 Tax=Corchorus olitorius TaxID=93759 RepID=A0A1R3KTB2_9ROSI|nr:hypothetical protein COLO4_04616 [Corchorus olitorius]
MCGGYQAERNELLGRQASNRNSEEFRRTIRALLDQMEQYRRELEQSLAELQNFVALVNKINFFFGSIVVVIWLFRLLKYFGFL